jgi:hypothetical protein
MLVPGLSSFATEETPLPSFSNLHIDTPARSTTPDLLPKRDVPREGRNAEIMDITDMGVWFSALQRSTRRTGEGRCGEEVMHSEYPRFLKRSTTPDFFSPRQDIREENPARHALDPTLIRTGGNYMSDWNNCDCNTFVESQPPCVERKREAEPPPSVEGRDRKAILERRAVLRGLLREKKEKKERKREVTKNK